MEITGQFQIYCRNIRSEKKSLWAAEGFFSLIDHRYQLVISSRKQLFLFLLSLRSLLRSLFLSRRPVVEVMGEVMAIMAFREFRHHRRGMRDFVAAPAIRDHLVLSGMAECAGQFLMLVIARAQQVQYFFVACPAILVGDIRAVSHDRRLVGLVAFFAVRLRHLG